MITIVNFSFENYVFVNISIMSIFVEFFLIKHKSKHSCKSVIFFDLSKGATESNSRFIYDYSITVIPSILDGGLKLFLPTLLNRRDSLYLSAP